MSRTATALQVDCKCEHLPRLLTVSEVAIELGLSESRVRQLIHEGALVAQKFGNHTRLLRSQVRAYIEQRFRPASADDEHPILDAWADGATIPTKEGAIAASRQWAKFALGKRWATRP